MVTKNVLKNKVIINIGSRGGARRKGRRRPTEGAVKRGSNYQPPPPPSQPPPPPQTYVIHHQAPLFQQAQQGIDPFRQQLATQSLNFQNQLRVNSDLLNSLRDDVRSQNDALSELTVRPMNLFPSIGRLPFTDTPHLPLDIPDVMMSPNNDGEGKEEAVGDDDELVVELEPSASSSSSSSSTSSKRTRYVLPPGKTPGPVEYVKSNQGSIKAVNPITGRLVYPAGQVFRDLLRDGLMIDMAIPRNLLAPGEN